MNMRIVSCITCGEEYHDSVRHTCTPQSLEMLFLYERDQPVYCSLNGDDLSRIRQEIIDNGSPAHLIAMWEKSAGRTWPG